jgi:AcrR family transcriptional regulator
MSPRRLDPSVRTALIDIAARLIYEAGPAALSTRRLAAEVGTSTMAVYTYFGSMQRLFDLVEPTDDAVADLALLGRAYRHNAVTNPDVFSVMFGGSSLSGFSLTEEDRQYGRYTLTAVIDCADRCVQTGRFREEDPALIAHQMWLGVHGTGTLELGAYLIDPYDADRCFEAQLISLMVGAGDDLGRAAESVAASKARFGTLPLGARSGPSGVAAS